VAYHRRCPISTIPVARITAHAMVPGFTFWFSFYFFVDSSFNIRTAVHIWMEKLKIMISSFLSSKRYNRLLKNRKICNSFHIFNKRQIINASI
jgi:hypothetical protein